MSWQVIYRHLRDDITKGSLPVGSRLPSLEHLTNTFGATSHQVRKALVRLKKEGLVNSWQGRGTVVADAPITSVIDIRPRLRRDAKSKGYEIETETVAARLRRPPAKVAAMLQLKYTQPIIYTERLVHMGSTTAQVVRHYIVYDRCPKLFSMINEIPSIRDALTGLGIADYRRDDVVMGARLPTDHEKALLGIPRSQPVIEVEYRSLLPDGTPIIVSTAISRADRINYLIVA